MKKKIFVSVVLAAILAVTMSFGCFASESTWILSDNKYVADNATAFSLAKATRTYYYSTTNGGTFYYGAGIESMSVPGGNKTTSNFTINVKKTDDNYSDIYNEYVINTGMTIGFDEYVLQNVPLKSSTTLDSYASGNTTTSISHIDNLAPVANSMYYVENLETSYYGTLYYGQINNGVVFGIQMLNQPHIYYN